MAVSGWHDPRTTVRGQLGQDTVGGGEQDALVQHLGDDPVVNRSARRIAVTIGTSASGAALTAAGVSLAAVRQRSCASRNS
jgi:hypothetical protein